MRRHSFFGLLVFFVVVGCESGEKVDVPKVADASNSPAVSPAANTASPLRKATLADDPAAHFKMFVVRFMDDLKQDKYFPGLMSLDPEWLPPEYDVRKTDSLVSPFVATLQLSVRQLSVIKDVERPAFWLTTYEFASPAQDGIWKFREPTFRHTYFPPNFVVGGKEKPHDVDSDLKGEMPRITKRFQDIWEAASIAE